MNEEDAAKLRAKLTADVADVWELHAEVATHKYEVNEFNTATNKSPWRVTLVDEKNRAVSTTDIKLDRGRREVTGELYPYLTIFSRGWKMRFPAQPARRHAAGHRRHQDADAAHRRAAGARSISDLER